MGGSLALALRGKCATLMAVDIDPSVVDFSLDNRIVDRAAVDPEEILPSADLIILATPIHSILDYLEKLPSFCQNHTYVLDLGSTKATIMEKMQALPEQFDPMGGHPICGKEVGGLANADANLFQNAVFALTPIDRTSPTYKEIAEELVVTIGAQPKYLDPEIHDRWIASTSHLPYLIANALAAKTPAEANLLVGPGLRSTTRLAPTSWSMMGDVLHSNRENVQSMLHDLIMYLQRFEYLLECENLDELGDLLTSGADRYNQIIRQSN